MVHVVPANQLPAAIVDLLEARARLAVARRAELQAILDHYEDQDVQLRTVAAGLGYQVSRELGHAEFRTVVRL